MIEEQIPLWTSTALQAAVAASEKIMTYFEDGFDSVHKADGSPVTQADLASNEIILSHLEGTGIPIVSEESIHSEYEIRKDWPLLWCIDPLDGTKEFVRKSREFAVCISLIHNQQPVLGIITSPVERTILVGGRSVPPAFLAFEDVSNPAHWRYIDRRQRVNEPLVIAISRSQDSNSDLAFNRRMRDRYGEVQFLKKGSALKFMDLAAGHADVYARYAPTMEWDIAAGHAIMEALGGRVIHAEKGHALYYNKANLFNPYFIVETAPVLTSSDL
jgi:3'(2'), 5'-bisphosphate nucleotidase